MAQGQGIQAPSSTWDDIQRQLFAIDAGVQHPSEKKNQDYEFINEVLRGDTSALTPDQIQILKDTQQSLLGSGGTLGNIARGTLYGLGEGLLSPAVVRALGFEDPGVATPGATVGRIAGNIGGFIAGPGKILRGAQTLARGAGLMGGYGALQGIGGHMESEQQKEGQREALAATGQEIPEMLQPNPATSMRTGLNVGAQALTSALGGHLAQKAIANPSVRNELLSAGSGVMEGIAGIGGQLFDAYGAQGAVDAATSSPGTMATLGGIGAGAPLALGAVGAAQARRAGRAQSAGDVPLRQAPSVELPPVAAPQQLSPSTERLLNLDPSSSMGGVDPRMLSGLKLAELERMAALSASLGERDLGQSMTKTDLGRFMASSPEGGDWRELVMGLDDLRNIGTSNPLGRFLAAAPGNPQDVQIARGEAFQPGGPLSRQRFLSSQGEEFEIPEGMTALLGAPSSKWDIGGVLTDARTVYEGPESSVVVFADNTIRVLPNELKSGTSEGRAPGGVVGPPSTSPVRQVPMTPEEQSASMEGSAQRLGVQLGPDATARDVSMKLKEIDDNLFSKQGSLFEEEEELVPGRWPTPSLNDPNQLKLPFFK